MKFTDADKLKAALGGLAEAPAVTVPASSAAMPPPPPPVVTRAGRIPTSDG